MSVAMPATTHHVSLTHGVHSFRCGVFAGEHKDCQFDLFGKPVTRVKFTEQGGFHGKRPTPITVGGEEVEAFCGKYEDAKRENMGSSAMLYFNGAFICWIHSFGELHIMPNEDAPEHQHGAIIVVNLTKRGADSKLPQPTKTKTTFESQNFKAFFIEVKRELNSYMEDIAEANPLTKLLRESIKGHQYDVQRYNTKLATNLKSPAARIEEAPLLSDMLQKVKNEAYTWIEHFRADLNEFFSNAIKYHASNVFEEPVWEYTKTKNTKEGCITVQQLMKHHGIPEPFRDMVLNANPEHKGLTYTSRLKYNTRIFVPGKDDVDLVKKLIEWQDGLPGEITAIWNTIKRSKEAAPEDTWATVSI